MSLLSNLRLNALVFGKGDSTLSLRFYFAADFYASDLSLFILLHRTYSRHQCLLGDGLQCACAQVDVQAGAGMAKGGVAFSI